jgi:hypothetical protein
MWKERRREENEKKETPVLEGVVKRSRLSGRNIRMCVE